MNTPDSSQTKSCIACGSEIPVQAKLCYKCNSFQKNWVNILKYLANIVGVLTLTAGAAAFIFTKIPEISRYFPLGDQLRILSFASFHNCVISNVSYGGIFVSHIDLEAYSPADSKEPWHTQTYFIDKFIESKSILTVTDEDAIPKSKWWVLSDVSDQEWNKAFEHADRAGSDGNSCFYFTFISPEDRLYIQYRNWFKDKLRTFKARAYINYYSIYTNRTKRQEIPVVGLILSNPDPKCEM